MNSKICAYLIHLSENMWGDTPVSTHPGYEGWPDGPAFRDKLRCDEKTWDMVVSALPAFGVNTLVVDVGDGVYFESHPELAIEGSWSKEKLSAKLAEAKRLGLTVIPKLNFSACHDIWMKEYSRMVSTPAYYRVVEDLIAETIELFDHPPLFHLGMDEENYENQRTYNYCVVRKDELWWSDLRRMTDCCGQKGVRPWVWSDICWTHPEAFWNNMPREVMQSNWYYGNGFAQFKKGVADPALAAFAELDALGFDQIPCGSNWAWMHNVEQLAVFCAEQISAEHFAGFMAAPWAFTHWHERFRLLDCGEKLGGAVKLLWNE